jgi:hypothetical protein
MSLKAFHILFISLAILLACGMAWWGFANGITPVFGSIAIAVAIALVVYGISFIRKARHIIV